MNEAVPPKRRAARTRVNTISNSRTNDQKTQSQYQPYKDAAWGFWKSAEYEAAKRLRAGKGHFFVTVLEGLPT